MLFRSRGIIIEQIPNVSLKIQTREENIFVYKIEEVEKITKELVPHKEKRQLNSLKQTNDYSSFNKPKGYMGLLEIEGGLGIGRFAADRAGISIINGYRAAPQFAFGIGFGTQLFFYWKEYIRNIEISVPFFLYLRSDFLKTKVSPYVAFNIGYNITVSGGLFDGILMEPTLGVGFNVGNYQNFRINIGLAYAIDRVKYIYSYDSYNYYENNDMGYAIKLKIGLSF